MSYWREVSRTGVSENVIGTCGRVSALEWAKLAADNSAKRVMIQPQVIPIYKGVISIGSHCARSDGQTINPHAASAAINKLSQPQNKLADGPARMTSASERGLMG